MSSYCEIVDKTTGDRVNWAAGIVAWLGFFALVALAVGRGCQEAKKHAEKSRVPTASVVTNAVQKVR